MPSSDINKVNKRLTFKARHITDKQFLFLFQILQVLDVLCVSKIISPKQKTDRYLAINAEDFNAQQKPQQFHILMTKYMTSQSCDWVLTHISINKV